VLAYYQKILPTDGWQTLNVQQNGITSKVINGTPPDTATYEFRLEVTTNPTGQPIYRIGLSNAIN
jgi:hypothetical protein